MIGRLWPALDNFRTRPDVQRQEDLPYAPHHPKQALDLFLPPKPEKGKPWVMFVHGGGWKRQDRKLLRLLSGLYGNVGMALAERGLPTAVVSYRQPDGWQGLQDLRYALDWLHNKAQAPLVVVGHSLGGLFASLLARDPHIAGIVSMGGAYDLQRLRTSLKGSDQRGLDSVFGPSLHDVFSPERQLDPQSAPHLLVIAEHDPEALQLEHHSMLAACQARGVPVSEHRVPGVGHMGLVLEMGRREDRVTEPIVAFVRGL
jgi:acetyl esterase/lipase